MASSTPSFTTSEPNAKLALVLALALLSVASSCSREEPDEGAPPPEEPKWDVLDSGPDISPLGFSGDEAAAMFEGSYEAELRYEDGSTTTLTINVEPSGVDLYSLSPSFYPRDVKYVYGGYSTRPSWWRGKIAEGPSLHLAVDVGFHSEDGQFDESLATVLRVMSVDFARLEPGVAQEDPNGTHELEGSFEITGSDYATLFTDLFRTSDGSQTSGWVAYLGDTDPRTRVVLAAWNICQVRFLDGGTQCLGVERLP